MAEDFDDILRSVLAARRTDSTVPTDVTGQLLHVEVHGRRLTDAEIMSVLGNWTGGHLGSIALCVGVLVHHLASHLELQSRLRGGVPHDEIDLVIDEVPRLGDPFVSNLRVTTCPVDVDGVRLPEGARVKLHRTSANRDAAVFGDPEAFDPAGHAADRHRQARLPRAAVGHDRIESRSPSTGTRRHVLMRGSVGAHGATCHCPAAPETKAGTEWSGAFVFPCLS